MRSGNLISVSGLLMKLDESFQLESIHLGQLIPHTNEVELKEHIENIRVLKRAISLITQIIERNEDAA